MEKHDDISTAAEMAMGSKERGHLGAQFYDLLTQLIDMCGSCYLLNIYYELMMDFIYICMIFNLHSPASRYYYPTYSWDK